MINGVFQLGDGRTAIVNGGDPLPGCPENWDDAKAWQGAANKAVEGEQAPKWGFDCGFKLDYDGPLITIESRFYPPKSHYGPMWDGQATLRISGRIVEEKKFDCDSLDELKQQVEAYKDLIQSKILGLF